MKKSIKFILIGIIAVLAIGYTVYSMTKPLEVKATKVEKADLISDFKEDAIVVSEDSYTISPPYDAKLTFIVEQGTNVNSGELIASMDDADLKNQKSQLSAQLKSVGGQQAMSKSPVYDSQVESLNIAIAMGKDQIARLETSYERAKALYDSGAIPKVEFEAAENALHDAKNQVKLKESELALIYESAAEKPGTSTYYSGQKEALQAQIRAIDEKLAKTKIYAPASGVITKSNAKSGAFVSTMTPIIELSSATQTVARANVLVQDAAALKLGQNVTVTQKIRNEEKHYPGTIVKISDYANTMQSPLGLEEQRVEVDVAFQSEEKLFLGYDLSLTIETMRKNSVIALPKTTVFEIDDKKYVWKIDGQTLKKQEVETGYESDFDYEITQGLSEGDLIILDPNDAQLEEGKKVKY